jgi:hypothetical protein
MAISDLLVPAPKGIEIEMESDVCVHENGHSRSSSVSNLLVDANGDSSSAPIPALDELGMPAVVVVLDSDVSPEETRYSSVARIIHPS